MKKKFAIKTLKKIKEIQETYHKLKALGVDLIDYENGVKSKVDVNTPEDFINWLDSWYDVV